MPDKLKLTRLEDAMRLDLMTTSDQTQKQDLYRAAHLNQLKSAIQRGLDSGNSEPWDVNALRNRRRTDSQHSKTP